MVNVAEPISSASVEEAHRIETGANVARANKELRMRVMIASPVLLPCASGPQTLNLDAQ
jgi:hypothetical protein